jgi:hypothetical protein
MIVLAVMRWNSVEYLLSVVKVRLEILSYFLVGLEYFLQKEWLGLEG